MRVLAPIPGKSAVGIELPNDKRETVRLDDITAGDHHPLTVALGKSVDGEMLNMNLGTMPHLLVSGTTGSGKSSFINTMLVSLLRRANPEQVKLVLIDPKMVELAPYEGIPHLVRPVVTEVDEAVETLEWVEREMDARYEAMKNARVRHIDGLGLPYIVVVVDDLADLMMTAADVMTMARDAQQAYRRWVDGRTDAADNADQLDDFINVALDVLERIAGQSIPPSRIHPEVHDHAVGDDHS